MKLSEAIRLGAMLRPQGFGAFRVDGRSCALGAAAEAAGIQRAIDQVGGGFAVIWRTWPWTLGEANFPLIGTRMNSYAEVIVGLNDTFRWTREQIADWVQTVEPAEPVTVDQPAATVTA